MALSRIGCKRINDIATDSSPEAIQCKLFYEQERDALLRSHWWKFAVARAALSEDSTAPAFEYEHQYILPSDCLRVISVYGDGSSYIIEGERLLTNETSCSIEYVRRVEDATKFDPMFVNVLSLAMSLRLAMPLTQDKTSYQLIAGELRDSLARCRIVNDQEMNNERVYPTWLESRRVNMGGRA